MNSRLSGGGRTLSLAWRLFARTIGAKYRKSFLGYFWMVAPALLITVGATLAHRAGIVNAGATVLPYPLFVLLGTLVWHVFAESFQVPHQAFEGARSYLTRVNFPREAIVLAQLFETLITAFVRLLLVLVLVAVVVGVDARGVFWLVTCFAATVVLGIGLGALLTPFMLLFTDLHHVLKLVLSYGLFLTPAMYQPSEGGAFATLLRLNPVWPLMDSAREAAASVPFTHPTALAAVLGGALLAAVCGFALLRVTAPIVIERMLLGGR